jgi:ABC-type branched-subunit amino acid transport system substrate-binding protein
MFNARLPRHTQRRYARIRVGALTCAGALLITACGGSSGSDGDNEIKIGIAGVQSGPAIAYKQIIDGQRAYFDQINKAGGIDGRKIKYEVKDTGYSADGVSRVVRELASSGDAVVTGVASPAIAALVPYMRKRDVMWAPFTAGDQLLPTSKNIFGMSPRYTQLGAYDAKQIVGRGAKNIAILYEDDAVGQPGLHGATAWLKAKGITPVVTAGFSNTETDLSALAARVKSKKVDGVIFWGLAPQFAAFMNASKSAGVKADVQGFFGLASDATVKAVGDAAEGVHFSEITLPGEKCADDYEAVMTAKFPDEVTPLSRQGWSLAALIVAGIREAAKNHDGLDAKTISAGIEKVAGTIGCTPGVEMSSTSHLATRQANTVVVENGKLVDVTEFEELPAVDVTK